MSKASAKNAELLSKYVDLINASGRDSTRAKNFRKQHAGNKELVKLIATTHSTQDALKSGGLKDGAA